MIEAAVIALRLLQYAGGSVLMGSALFPFYALDGARPAWQRSLLVAAGLTLCVAALLSFCAQTAMLAGSWGVAFTRDGMTAMAGLSLGQAALWRAGAAGAAALVLLAAWPTRASRIVSAALGTLAVATFGWMGHGADSKNWLQLIADIVHALAAASWIGALAAFVLLLRSRAEPASVERALRRFSAVGVPLVLLLVLTGIVNAWFLVGMGNVTRLLTTDYGRLLTIKLALFLGMLVLAAFNRNRHTTAIARQPGHPEAVRSLRRSVACEFALGLAVLGAVAWFGTLAPPSATLGEP